MSTELIVLLCAVYAIGVIAAAAVLHAKGLGDGLLDMGVGVIALFWPLYFAIIIVSWPVSWLGQWVAKAGGWK